EPFFLGSTPLVAKSSSFSFLEARETTLRRSTAGLLALSQVWRFSTFCINSRIATRHRSPLQDEGTVVNFLVLQAITSLATAHRYILKASSSKPRITFRSTLTAFVPKTSGVTRTTFTNLIKNRFLNPISARSTSVLLTRA